MLQHISIYDALFKIIKQSHVYDYILEITVHLQETQTVLGQLAVQICIGLFEVV